ncbi:MAG: hypothetical protein H6841_07870 [Planctomycetes bacterium]|nr:hypothetical protein [Planctomycetota bacterium]MCB9935488.1 hypothetical protein [Planctomycetota bacterium]
MSVQIRCNCGWNSQVSDFYLGDRVACPQCGEKLNVHAQAGVPYGYPPYPTWQKQTAPRPNVWLPRPRRAPVAPDNPHSAAAFVLGLMAMLLAFTGCGTPLGAAVAFCAVMSAMRSRSWSRQQGRPLDTNTKLGFGFSLVAVMISALLFLAVLGESTRTHCPPHCVKPVQVQPVKPEVKVFPEYRYRDTRPSEPPGNLAPQPGYRYPQPKPSNNGQWSYNTSPAEKEDVLDRVRREMHEEDLRKQAQAKRQAGPEKPAPKAPVPEYRYGK